MALSKRCFMFTCSWGLTVRLISRLLCASAKATVSSNMCLVLLMMVHARWFSSLPQFEFFCKTHTRSSLWEGEGTQVSCPCQGLLNETAPPLHTRCVHALVPFFAAAPLFFFGGLHVLPCRCILFITSPLHSLPRAPPILFGVSPTVLPRPGYWPAKVGNNDMLIDGKTTAVALNRWSPI